MSDPYAPLKVASIDPSLAPYQQASGYSTPVDLDGQPSPFGRDWNGNFQPQMPNDNQEPVPTNTQQQSFTGNYDMPFGTTQYQPSNGYINQQGLSIDTNDNRLPWDPTKHNESSGES